MTAPNGGVHRQLCCREDTAVALSAIDRRSAAHEPAPAAHEPGTNRARTERDSPCRPWRRDVVAGTMLRVPQTPPQAEPVRWTTFTRLDLRALIEVLQRTATSGDAGAYGHGVEVIVESPTLGRWDRLLARPGHGLDRDRAHIAVTDGRGRCGYPVHIRLYTTHGPAAGRQLDRRSGWATSNTAGQAILMMKARAASDGYDAVELATGTINALADLHGREPAGDWRFRVDRAVVRT